MLIKKLLHITLTILLIVSTMGLTINKHYSNDKLFSTSIFFEAEACCEIPCGCCDDESVLIKVENDYLSSSLEIEDISFVYLFDSKLTFDWVNIPSFYGIIHNISDNLSPPKYGDYISLIQSFLL